MQFSYACLNFKVGSECLLHGISCIRLASIGLQYELPIHVYLMQLCRGRVSVQQFRDGVMLRMCCGFFRIVRKKDPYTVTREHLLRVHHYSRWKAWVRGYLS